MWWAAASSVDWLVARRCPPFLHPGRFVVDEV
jgi:hypothetical protein